MLKRSTPVLASLDKEGTIKFYTEKLGFNFETEHNGYLIFRRDGVHIHLFPCSNAGECRNMGCYIYVTDIESLYDEYQTAGIVHPNGPLKMMPWGLRQFAIVDNNGNIFYIADDRQPGAKD